MTRWTARASFSLACLALGVAVAPSTAVAADALHGTCTGTVNWSLTSTTATATYVPTACQSDLAHAGISGGLPQFSLSSGPPVPPPSTHTFAYHPVNATCLGTLSDTLGNWTFTGVLRNDGVENTEIVVQATTTNPTGEATEVHVGVLQQACSSTFTTKSTWTETWAAS
jgi:hypothetical protein